MKGQINTNDTTIYINEERSLLSTLTVRGGRKRVSNSAENGFLIDQTAS